MLVADMQTADSRTQFRIQVGNRPRAIVCRTRTALGHRLRTVPFFVFSRGVRGVDG